MSIRTRTLPTGWYPDTEAEILHQFNQWPKSEVRHSLAAIVPHAGWYFSGSLAFETISSLDKDIDIVLLIGGHLSRDTSLLVYDEDSLYTPLGQIDTSKELLQMLSSQFSVKTDLDTDNTVEINLPFIKYFLPESEIVACRLGSFDIAKKLATFLLQAEKTLSKKIAVIASTDLIHYGPNYMYTPYGLGSDAFKTISEKDKGFVHALEQLDTSSILKNLEDYHTACSPAGVLAVINFAKQKHFSNTFSKYMNSYNVHKDKSFVGYSGLNFSPIQN